VDGNLIPAPGAIVAIGAAATLGVRRGTRTNATEAQRPQSTQSETTPALEKEPAKIRAKKITKKPK